MKTKKVVNQAEKLPSDLRHSILSLIDTKTEYDMEQVIGKIDQMQSQIGQTYSQTQQMESRLESQTQQMESRLDSRLESQAQQMEGRLESQMQQIRWFIGGAIAIVCILVTAIFKTITLGSAIALR